jgi:IS1 family transposase
VSAIATSLTHSGKRRLFRCRTCATHFAETRETVFFDLRPSEEKVIMALKMLLVRVALAGIGFVLGVTEATVLDWLRRAAHQAEAINRHLLRDLPVTQVQLDEMWNFVERKHARETDEAGKSLPNGEDGRQWVWISFAPEFRLMIAAVVGPRTLDTAKEVVAATQACVAGLPAFFSDGCTCYLAALIAACHVVTTFARTGKQGRPRTAYLCAPSGSNLWAVGQTEKAGQTADAQQTLSTRIVLGGERLRQLGLTMSTALVERVNLTVRQALAPLGRKTYSFCKDRERLQQRVVFFQAFYNVARPHMSLRQPLSPGERTHSGAIRPRCRQRTPAMAAGLTDHVWTLRELLTAKCEPLESQSISQ